MAFLEIRGLGKSYGTAKILDDIQLTAERGEVLGLRWKDVDLDNACLSVTQTLSNNSKGLQFLPPKTEKSRRRISLMALTIEALKQHRKSQARHRLKLGPLWQDNGLVFPSEDGTPWHPDTFSGAWRKLQSDAAIDCGFHGLRHTHATQLLRQGVHPKIVSERLGHASVAITLDLYSHLLPGMQEDAAAKLNRVLKRAMMKEEG